MITRTLVAGLTMLLVLASAPAAAQTSRMEVSGGYQVTRATDQTLPAGWNAALAINLTDAWAVVGEVGNSYKTVNHETLGVDVRLRIRTVGGGARWSVRPIWRLAPFVQFLAGAARSSASAQILGRDVGDSATDFMLQPGGGVHVRVSDQLGLVGQLDYRRIVVDDGEDVDSAENQVRVVAGVRFGF